MQGFRVLLIPPCFIARWQWTKHRCRTSAPCSCQQWNRSTRASSSSFGGTILLETPWKSSGSPRMLTTRNHSRSLYSLYYQLLHLNMLEHVIKTYSSTCFHFDKTWSATVSYILAGDFCGRGGRWCRRREERVLPPDHERAVGSQIWDVSLLRGVQAHLVFKQGTPLCNSWNMTSLTFSSVQSEALTRCRQCSPIFCVCAYFCLLVNEMQRFESAYFKMFDDNPLLLLDLWGHWFVQPYRGHLRSGHLQSHYSGAPLPRGPLQEASEEETNTWWSEGAHARCRKVRSEVSMCSTFRPSVLLSCV